MSDNTVSNRYLLWASFVISVLALVIAVAVFMGCGNSSPAASASSSAPAAPGNPPQRGGMGGGPGMMMSHQPNPAVEKILAERIEILRGALADAQKSHQSGVNPVESVWQAQVALDTALVLQMRSGSFRMMPGATEAFLKFKLAAAQAAEAQKAFSGGSISQEALTARRLSANNAELEFQQALQRVRAGRKAFEQHTEESFKEYPATPADEATLKALYQAEIRK